MNNYITERELKGFIPELSKYLWTNEISFDKQRVQAEQIVISDLANKGYLIRQLQPKVYIGEDGTEVLGNMLRFVCEATTQGSVTLYGSLEEDGTYKELVTLNYQVAGLDSFLLKDVFRYYKVDDDAFEPFLVETTYDRLFAYKWLELILVDAFKEQGDAYFEKMMYFKEEYKTLLNGLNISIDSDDDGEADTTANSSSINVMR